jgi:cobalt-zinc-cadmium efflux system outer membrane protein
MKRMKCRNQQITTSIGTMLVWGVLCSGVSALNAEATATVSTSPPQNSLSLAEAQQRAFERNWDLLAAAVGVDAATALKIVSHEFPNPTLSLSTLKISVDGTPASTAEGNDFWDRNYDTIFAINQLFEIGGKRRNRQRSAQAGYEGAKAQFFDAKRTLDLAVAKAYVASAQAQENVIVLRQSAATLRQEAQIADVRFKAGEISSSDKSQIEITAERFELDAKAAETASAQAQVALEVLMGVPRPKGELTLTDRLEALSAQAAPPATNVSGVGRPDVLAAEAAMRKAEADWRLQRAMRVPDPTVLAQYEHEPPDTPNTVGFGVSFPLPLWNHNRGNIMAANAVREQARLAYEKISAQAAADIAVARLAYEDALRRWQTYRQSIRPKSEEVRKTLAYSYQKGGASLLDMLVAERNDNDVRIAAMQAASDAAAALASLKAATQFIEPSQLRK